MRCMKAITVWKDGTWQVWSVLDAYYAREDPDWLVEILVGPTGIEPVPCSNLELSGV